MTIVTKRSRKGDDEMSRYERRMQFERWYAMREAYRAAPAGEHRAVISIEAAIRLADALVAGTAPEAGQDAGAGTGTEGAEPRRRR